MNISQDTLNEWAGTILDANGSLLAIKDYLRQSNAPQDIQTRLEHAAARLWRMKKQMQRNGADDPLPRRLFTPKPVTLEMLNSPANVRLARLLREAAQAAAEVEEERGQDASLSEALSDYAEGTEFEVHGPKGLEGIEG